MAVTVGKVGLHFFGVDVSVHIESMVFSTLLGLQSSAGCTIIKSHRLQKFQVYCCKIESDFPKISAIVKTM